MIEIQKIMNQKDGSRKQETIKIYAGKSTNPPLWNCPECKQVGIRTVEWGSELHICTNLNCDIKYYSKGMVYYA